MFDRPAYKKTARKQLKGRWLFPILLTAIIAVLLALLGVINVDTRQGGGLFWYRYAVSLSGQNGVLLIPVICIIGILTIASAHVYLRLAQTLDGVSFPDFLTGLEQWLSGALGGLWYALWVFLWSLLFFFPGIVKAIAYSQMFFILAENKGIGVRKAMTISKIITQGHKGDLFLMALSFIGWGILCMISCGIGFLWLSPYMTMSYTNSYFALKNMALMAGKISPADFAPAQD